MFKCHFNSFKHISTIIWIAMWLAIILARSTVTWDIHSIPCLPYMQWLWMYVGSSHYSSKWISALFVSVCGNCKNSDESVWCLFPKIFMGPKRLADSEDQQCLSVLRELDICDLAKSVQSFWIFLALCYKVNENIMNACCLIMHNTSICCRGGEQRRG